jgi:ATP-binding cassette subfamily C protein LapB
MGEPPSIAPVAPAADVPHASAGERDPLLACLVALAAYHDRAPSPQALVAGLPLVMGRLTPDLFVRAAERAGFASTVVRRSLGQLNPVVLPAVLLLKEGDACIALRKPSRKTIEVLDPHTNARTTIAAKDLAKAYTGLAILLKPELRLASRDHSAPEQPAGHWFWSVIRQLWPTYMQVAVAAAIINVLALASPLFVMNVYDRVLPNKAQSTLWVLAVGVGLAVLFDFILRTLRGWIVDTAGRRADVLLASRIFEHVLSIKLGNRPSTTGSFANQLKDFDTVREFFTSNTIATITDLLFFGIFLLVIYLIGGPLVWVPAGAAAFVFLIALVVQWPLGRAAAKTQAESAYRHSVLVEAISSLETVKTIRAESWLQRIWERLVGQTARTMETTRGYMNLMLNLTMVVSQLVSIGIILIGAHLYEKGEITTGAIIACTILAGRCIAPFAQFAVLIARSQQSFQALKSINQLMALPSERAHGRKFVNHPDIRGAIEFRNVTFTYPGAPHPALREVNLKIEPGERVGLIGKIGSGKTTFGRLLSLIYEAQAGTILLDGIDIRQFHPHDVRRTIGVLTQDADLFYGSVRDNILMAAPDAADEDLHRAVKLAGVADFTARHPAGIDMPVGERGNLLSGGQRQAVALARILLADPKVIFLDEPSGSMDLQSERQLISQLRTALKPNQTIIVSTHRHSMLELIDRIIVLANGGVGADGPKEAVLEAMKAQFAANAAGPPGAPRAQVHTISIAKP